VGLGWSCGRKERRRGEMRVCEREKQRQRDEQDERKEKKSDVQKNRVMSEATEKRTATDENRLEMENEKE
jgi:hypothetical protein